VRNQVTFDMSAFGVSRPADITQLAVERGQQLFAIDLQRLHASPPALGLSALSSLGNWLAHWVMVPGPETDDIVTRPGDLGDHRRKRRRPVDQPRVTMPARLHAHHQMGRINALDRIFAGRIDRRHDHRVGIVEAGGKIVKQAFKPV
jgi:hypothetical protein